MSISRSVPGAASSEGTYAIPIPIPSDGDIVPLVTSPTRSPPWRTGLPGLGIPRSVSTNGASFSAGPSARTLAIASEPMNPVSSLQHHPSPASIGVRSVVRSLPYSGKHTSSRSVSRAPSPAGTTPTSSSASHTPRTSSGASSSSTPSSPV
jgi:hypothetical protein